MGSEENTHYLSFIYKQTKTRTILAIVFYINACTSEAKCAFEAGIEVILKPGNIV